MKELIPRSTIKTAARLNALQAVASRQIVPGEQVYYSEIVRKKHVAITDRRLLITSLGWGGEQAESIPLGCVTSLNVQSHDGEVKVLQISVAGRSWGDLVLLGDRLNDVHAFLIQSLPVHRSNT